MAFAPGSTYFNTGDGSIQGCFIEKDRGNIFEYSMNPDFDMFNDPTTGRAIEYPHLVWVRDSSNGIDCGYRKALVRKTVAYVVVDEDENGPVIEKWYFKSRRRLYTTKEQPSTGDRMMMKISGEIGLVTLVEDDVI